MRQRRAQRISERRRTQPQGQQLTGDARVAAPLTVEAVEEMVGIAAVDWDAASIAEVIASRGLIDGRPARGFWTGPLDATSDVALDASGRVPHGWLVTPMGFVVDFTRWRFEQAAPYVYEGPADHYDERTT